MMRQKKDGKFVYAQSSDIKARTYIEYRKDMKKKAIAELEIKEWLEKKLKERFDKFDKKDIRLEKYGGDRFLWFLRSGGITREPDFIVHLGNDQKLLVEFQYADKENLKFYDFKTYKVATKAGKKWEPHKDRIFIYLFKNSLKYAFIPPEWIVDKGEVSGVPAWGNREAFRVPKEQLNKILKEDKSLKEFIDLIDAKCHILYFQHNLIDRWRNTLSNELQKVIDENKLVKIVPCNLVGFFKVCFILDHLSKVPENINLWLLYLLSYVNSNKLTLKEIAMLVFSLDFLYTHTNLLQQHELKEIENKVILLIELINSYYRVDEYIYKSSISESPLEETRYAIFSINLIEDIIQDAIYYYNANFQPITKIYQHLMDPLKIASKILET